MTPTTAPHYRVVDPSSRDLRVVVIALLVIVAWEVSGLDLTLTRLAAAGQAFPWREHWLTSKVLHDGGRIAGWVAAAVLAWHVWRPGSGGPSRHEWATCLLGTVVSLLAVPGIKRLSTTSCPWDLAEFGGKAAYVAHWQLGVVDGGPGHCFPSGHAVAAFGFLGVYHLWRRHRPRLAAWLLTAVLVAGAAFGVAQCLRGAHHASHVMWSAWLCWVVASACDAVSRRRSYSNNEA